MKLLVLINKKRVHWVSRQTNLKNAENGNEMRLIYKIYSLDISIMMSENQMEPVPMLIQAALKMENFWIYVSKRLLVSMKFPI